MRRRGSSQALLISGLLLALVAVGALAYWLVTRTFYETVEITDVRPPAPTDHDLLTDDSLDDKQPKFDPALVDRRPLGEWLVNQSAAVIKLDILMVRPDLEPGLLTLYPSYADAVKAARERPGAAVLPSVNLIDGKAKQFDDGLYAALDQAYYRGLDNTLHSHVTLVQRLYEKVGKDSPAAPFLAAGLELAGVRVETADPAKKDEWLRRFQASPLASKPIGFYTWNETLERCFRFLRFFQHEFSAGDLAVPLAIARALEQDSGLLADYQKANAFYARLTNPLSCLTVADLKGLTDSGQLAQRAKAKGVKDATVALFPPSTSKETVLFEKLFPFGLPADANLMNELIRKVRSGAVNLAPAADSGWYEHQVYALETLLLPERGEEREKLLLTKAYKKRMLEAFQALITKRRETHARQMKHAVGAAAPPPAEVRPRLRVEPCPSYYLRTARAYAFLANFLESSVGKEGLQALRGLKQGGEREQNLYDELHFMRDLFYGLYLVSTEDIGMKPAFAKDEAVDQERCYKLAEEWLARAFDDPDLAADTRVSIPIYADPNRGTTRLWMTVGVRLAKLEASYARPPHIKPRPGAEPTAGEDPAQPKPAAEWQEVEAFRTAKVVYLIPVDEFAEVELRGLRVLTREELRAICDREKTKAAILNALKQ